MTQISGWVTFRQIVDDIMLSWGDASDPGQFMRYLNFAIKGYEELRLHSLPAIKTVTLPIESEMKIVVLPGDFLKFVSVGQSSGGKFYEFRPKSGMTVLSTADCGVTTRDTVVYESIPAYYVAYYSLDLENRRIIIEAPEAITEVILNYTPTGVKMDGVTYIPRMCRSVIEAFVEYEIVKRDKGHNMGDRILFERDYLKALMLFRGLQYNTDELFNEYYEHIITGRQY